MNANIIAADGFLSIEQSIEQNSHFLMRKFRDENSGNFFLLSSATQDPFKKRLHEKYIRGNLDYPEREENQIHR
jgi:hypothetical protein